MFSETLIESMSHHQNGMRLLTVQLAAIVHAAIVGVLIAGSFWYVDRISLPEPNKISTFLYEKTPGGPSPAHGVRHPKNTETAAVSKEVSVSTPATQQIVPETINNISDKALPLIEHNGNDLTGDPNGVQGGDPNSKSGSGFGGTTGDGTGTITNSEQIHHPTEIGVQMPVIMTQVKPVYPELLRHARKEGIVILEAVIANTGSVQNIKILQSTHPLFSQSATDAVLQWKYRPATLNGRVIAVYFKVTVRFTLR